MCVANEYFWKLYNRPKIKVFEKYFWLNGPENNPAQLKSMQTFSLILN
jgi:hypothetical protein